RMVLPEARDRLGGGALVREMSSTVGVQGLTGNVGAVGGRQEDVAGGYLTGLTGAAEQHILAAGMQAGGAEGGRARRRPDGGGRGAGGGDALLGGELSHGPARRLDRARGGGIIDQVLAAAMGGDRRGVDGASALGQVIEGGAHQMDVAED